MSASPGMDVTRVDLHRSDVCAVIVTYFPDADCAENLLALASQVNAILLVDNGSDERSFQPFESVARRINATVVRLGSNLGIAAALNVGLQFAKEQGYRWLATFDQDSRATPDMIAEMFRGRKNGPRPDEIAIIVPSMIDQRVGFDVSYPVSEEEGADWRIVPCAATSGNVIDVQIAGEVGGFDASLFIDFVDFDFCLRVRQKGYRILQAKRAHLLHSLGNIKLASLLSNRVPVTNHSAVRRYYMSRNRIIVWRRYWRHELAWFIRDIKYFLLETTCIVFFERERVKKLAMILRGLRDGCLDVRGPLELGTRVNCADR